MRLFSREKKLPAEYLTVKMEIKIDKINGCWCGWSEEQICSSQAKMHKLVKLAEKMYAQLAPRPTDDTKITIHVNGVVEGNVTEEIFSSLEAYNNFIPTSLLKVQDNCFQVICAKLTCAK